MQHEDSDCDIALSEVYLYLDLECSEERRRLVQKHLEECSKCMREFGIEKDVKALVGRCCGDERAPSELRDRLRHKLGQLEVQSETRESLP